MDFDSWDDSEQTFKQKIESNIGHNYITCTYKISHAYTTWKIIDLKAVIRYNKNKLSYDNFTFYIDHFKTGKMIKLGPKNITNTGWIILTPELADEIGLDWDTWTSFKSWEVQDNTKLVTIHIKITGMGNLTKMVSTWVGCGNLYSIDEMCDCSNIDRIFEMINHTNTWLVNICEFPNLPEKTIKDLLKATGNFIGTKKWADLTKNDIPFIKQCLSVYNK